MAQSNHSALNSVEILNTNARNEERKRLALQEDARRAAAGQAAGRGKRRV